MGTRPGILSDSERQARLHAWYADPPVRFRPAGSSGVAGGPIIEAGWYVDPFCHPTCCRPFGPLPDWEVAREWAWTTHGVPEALRVPAEQAQHPRALTGDRRGRRRNSGGHPAMR